MSAAVVTITRPSDVHGYTSGNKKVRYFDITTDTGDYAAGGFLINVADQPPTGFGLKHVEICTVDGGCATSGTAGATASPIGVRYGSSGTTVRFQCYEAGSSGAPLGEKGAEAMEANFTFRVRVEGN